MVSPFNYDLNANTSHQRPVQFSKEQEKALIQSIKPETIQKSTESKPMPKPSANETDQVKRKRGRPRKEKKEKLVL
jgi:hypothetical protein